MDVRTLAGWAVIVIYHFLLEGNTKYFLVLHPSSFLEVSPTYHKVYIVSLHATISIHNTIFLHNGRPDNYPSGT